MYKKIIIIKRCMVERLAHFKMITFLSQGYITAFIRDKKTVKLKSTQTGYNTKHVLQLQPIHWWW